MAFKDLNLFFKIYIGFISMFFGMCMGSFLNCLAYRISHNISIIKGRSRCDNCHHLLAFKDLIPFFSYLQTKGRCRYCGNKLDKRYLISEVLCGLVYLLTVIRYGLSLSTVQYLILNSLLICASFFDIESHIIPDHIVIIGIINRIVFCIASGAFIDCLLSSLKNSLIITIPLIVFVIVVSKMIKKEAMGGGDIKLIFMASMYLSNINNLFALTLACISAILHAYIKNKYDMRIIFGPYISFGYIVCVLFGSVFF